MPTSWFREEKMHINFIRDVYAMLSMQYPWVILHNYFTIRNCLSRGPVVENDVEW